MRKALQMVVVFKFNDVEDVDGADADKIIQEMTDATDDWRIDTGADAVSIDAAVVINRDTLQVLP